MEMPTCEDKPSYMHHPGATPFCSITLGQLVDVAAERWGDKEAIVCTYQNERITFIEARDRADRLAAGLLQLGLSPGDRVGMWSPNSSEWYITRLAAARAGLIILQLDPAFEPPELLHTLTMVGAKGLICAEKYKSKSYYKQVLTLVPELESGLGFKSAQIPSLETLVIISDELHRGAHRFKDIIESASSESLERIRVLQSNIQPDDPTTIQFTSGTTGFPKAVVWTHHKLINNAVSTGIRMLSSKEDTVIVASQFCHALASIIGIYCNLKFGSTTVIATPAFDGEKSLKAIQQERCTVMLATPSLYVEVVDKKKALGISISTLQKVIVSGAPCSQELFKDLYEVLGVSTVIPLYGMTETGITFMTRKEDAITGPSFVGCLMDHLEAKVVDSDGRMVPLGTPGQLYVRGYSTMLEYYGEEEKTRQFINSNGWAKTGDRFVLQENGTACIVGRIKDMIIRVADNIFPVELEDFFQKHPDILEAQVFGVPDRQVGEEICVYIRATEGAVLTEKDIQNYCEHKIAEYRIPRYIRFVKEFERSAMGKVQKHRLLEKLLKEISATNDTN